jgi:hypothetical protein
MNTWNLFGIMHSAKLVGSNDAAQNNNNSVGDVLVLLLPLLGLLKINFIGELFVHEIILILLFPALLLKKSHLLGQKLIKLIFFFGCMWLGAQILTDIIQKIPFEDFARGWAKILFFLISFASLVMLLTSQSRVLLWFAGSIIPIFFRPFQLFELNLDPLVLWKFGVGSAVLSALCFPLLYRHYRDLNDLKSIRRIAVLHFIIGGLSFFLNARSFAGLAVSTGLLVWFYPAYGYKLVKVRSLVTGMFLFVVTGFVLLQIYSFGAGNGYFGDVAKEKYESQVMYGGGTIDIILGGRAEALVSTVAIADSPIIGHGSWAKDYRYIALLMELRARYSEVNPNALSGEVWDGLIPSHSYLLGAWVESGIVGALFWVVIIGISFFSVLPAAIGIGNWLGLLVIMLLPSLFWNIIFSPFGANVRVETAGVLAIFAFVLTQMKAKQDSGLKSV